MEKRTYELTGWEYEMVSMALKAQGKNSANSDNAKANYLKVLKSLEDQR